VVAANLNLGATEDLTILETEQNYLVHGLLLTMHDSNVLNLTKWNDQTASGALFFLLLRQTINEIREPGTGPVGVHNQS
jgi:hypothetical protein